MLPKANRLDFPAVSVSSKCLIWMASRRGLEPLTPGLGNHGRLLQADPQIINNLNILRCTMERRGFIKPDTDRTREPSPSLYKRFSLHLILLLIRFDRFGLSQRFPSAKLVQGTSD
jgi:hypothetical protein